MSDWLPLLFDRLPLLFCALIVLLIAVALFDKRRKRRAKIASILAGQGIVARWKYSPEEWRRYAEEEFGWVRHRDVPGEAYFTPGAVYVTNGSDHFFRDLEEKGKKVAAVSYKGVPPIFKMRVRWKVKNRNSTSYYSEDLRIPVPRGGEPEATRLAEYFTERAEKESGAVFDVTPDDVPIRLFGGEDL